MLLSDLHWFALSDQDSALHLSLSYLRYFCFRNIEGNVQKQFLFKIENMWISSKGTECLPQTQIF